jgi:hypothetical protein
VYWYDALSGSVIQYSGNALFPCSDNGLASEFSKYKKYPSTAIRGVFDRRYGEVVMVTSYGSLKNTWAFNVKNNVWVSKYSFYPDMIASDSQRLISWVADELWEHEKGLQMNFYGTQFEFVISFVFNKGNSYQKLYLNMDVEAEFSSPDADTFYAPLIISSQSDIKAQISELIEKDFQVRENAYKAAFLRDSLSGGTDPLIQGDMLKGYWMRVDLTHKNTAPMYLYAATVYFNVAEPTNR